MAGTDLVGDAIAELYSADPDAFIERRKELAARARSAGDREAARTITGLGKPTRSAWVVNRLVHADPSVAADLAELGGRLRGQEALDGAGIRELSRQRRELLDSLVRRALDEAGQQSPSVALRDEVSGTFSAALADPGVAGQVAAGTLRKAVHWAGFGPGIGSAISTGPARAPAPRATPAGRPAAADAADAAAGIRAAKAAPARRAGGRAGGAADADGAGAAGRREVTAAAAREEAAARAERDRQERREIVARAEAAAADAARAADEASAAEREISDSVSFMQERLSREQQRLVKARRDARQAAAAAARAQQALAKIRSQFS